MPPFCAFCVAATSHADNVAFRHSFADELVLEQVPAYLRESFPGLLTHRSGAQRELVDALAFLPANGTPMADLCKMFDVSAREAHLRHEAMYLSAVSEFSLAVRQALKTARKDAKR